MAPQRFFVAEPSNGRGDGAQEGVAVAGIAEFAVWLGRERAGGDHGHEFVEREKIAVDLRDDRREIVAGVREIGNVAAKAAAMLEQLLDGRVAAGPTGGKVRQIGADRGGKADAASSTAA